MSERLRVLLVITELDRGGAERVVVDLVNRLDRRFVDPHVATLWPGGELAAAVQAAGAPLSVLSGERRLAFGQVMGLRRIVARGNFDILHSHLPAAGLVSSLALRFMRPRPSHVYTEHNVPAGFSRIARTINSVAVLMPDRVVAVSHEVRRAWIAYGSNRHKRSSVVWNGIEIPDRPPDDTTRSRMRRDLGLSRDVVVFIMVASLQARKGHAVLLDALANAKLVESVLLVVGDGPLQPALRARAVELGIDRKVIFLGLRSDVPDLLAASDVFVLPSLAEGLPIALLEAMAHGLPCVASRAGGTTEVVEDGRSGFLVEPGDASGLAVELERLAADAEERRKTGAAARERVLRDFSVTSMAHAYLDIYRAVRPSSTSAH